MIIYVTEEAEMQRKSDDRGRVSGGWRGNCSHQIGTVN